MLGFCHKVPIFGQRWDLAFHSLMPPYFSASFDSCSSSRMLWTRKKPWKNIAKVFYLLFHSHFAFFFFFFFFFDALSLSRNIALGSFMGFLCQFLRNLPTTQFPELRGILHWPTQTYSFVTVYCLYLWFLWLHYNPIWVRYWESR